MSDNNVKFTIEGSNEGTGVKESQSGEIVIIDGKKFLKTSSSTKETSFSQKITTTSRTTITRRRTSAQLVIIKLSFRDFIGFESLHPFIANIRPTGMELRPNKDIVMQDVNALIPRLRSAASESIPFPENTEDTVYNFCWKNDSMLYYSTIVLLEMKQNKVDLNTINDFAVTHDTIIQFLKDEYNHNKEKNPALFVDKDFMVIAKTIHQTCKDIKLMMKSVNLADIKDTRVAGVMKDLEMHRKRCKEAIDPVIENEKSMSTEIFRQCRRTYITSINSLNNMIFKSSIVDHNTDYKSNLAYYVGILAHNVQLFIDSEPKAKAHIEALIAAGLISSDSDRKRRRSSGNKEEASDDNPERSRRRDRRLRNDDADDSAPISLSELRSAPREDDAKPDRSFATSTDALMKKKKPNDAQIRLRPNELGSQSVSLFMLKAKRRSILLDPSEEKSALLHSPTCPHVTFDFDHTGPLENEQPQIVEDEESGSPLTGEASAPAEEPKKEGIPAELYPQPIKFPNFNSWHPENVTNSIRQPRVPAVSLDKLKSHSAKRSKLGFLSGSLSNVFSSSHDFASLRIKKIDDVLVAPEMQAMEPDEAEEELQDAIIQLQKCREEYAEIEHTSIEQRAFFFCKWQKTLDEAPQLVKVTTEKKPESDAIKMATDLLIALSHANDEVIARLEIKQWESPRDAINHVAELLRIMIISLNYAEEDMKVSKIANVTIDEVKDWKRYYTEMLQNIEIINSAHDNVVVVRHLKYIGEARSHWSSFGSTAERIDRETNRQIMVITHKTLISTADNIILFFKTAELMDLTTRPQMVNYLENVRTKLQAVRKNRIMAVAPIVGVCDTLITGIISEINVDNANLEACDADRFCQQLGDITNKVEEAVPKVKHSGQLEILIEFHEYMTAARYNLLTMRVGDSEKEPDLNPLLAANIADFEAMEKQFRAAAQEANIPPANADFCIKWADHIAKCKTSLQDIDNVSDLITRNPSRYDAAGSHLINIGKNIRVCERQDFAQIVSVTTQYTKTTTDLQITIDYLTDTPNKLRRQGLETSYKGAPQPQVPAFQGLTTQMDASATTAIVIDLKPYMNGFMDQPAQIKANIASAMPGENDHDIIDELQRLICRLSSAQVDALSRNYNLSTKSTDVLYNLVITYCQSIITISQLIEDAVEKEDITEVKKCVESHIKKLNAIQSSYNDKAIYSEFAQKRLMIYAQTCRVLGRVTELNMHRISPEVNFLESALNSDMRQLTVNIAFFPKFPSTTAALALKDLIRVNKAAHDDIKFELTPIILSEAKFLTRIMDLVQNFYGEADVRFFRMEPAQIEKLDSAVVMVRDVKFDPFESAKTPTAQVKRNLDTVSDNFHLYQTMLQEGEYNAEKLCELSVFLSQSVVTFIQSALTIENGDERFYRHVYDFQSNYLELINTLKTHAEIGSQRLYSTQAKHCMQKVRISITTTNRRLALMEQLDSQACIESQQVSMDTSLSILARLAKLLLIARDNLRVETDKAKCQGPRRVLSTAVCSSYECTAQTILTVKNKVTQLSIKPKVMELRGLIWAAQDLLDAAEYLLFEIRGTVLDDIESIEFWIGAAMAPIIKALGLIAVSIPPSIPQAAVMRRKVSVIHAKCEICTEPFQECRAFTVAQ